MGRVIIIIVALFLFFGVFFGAIMNGVDDWRSDATTQNFLVTTGAGADSANITLSFDLYQAALANVSSIVSTNTTDTPVATDYNEDYKRLTVGGLAMGVTRTLTVDYLSETEETSLRLIGPFLGFLIIGGVLYFLFKITKKGR